MTRIKIVLLAAFAVFFVSGVMAAEKTDPACQTISQWFGDTDYTALNHRDYANLMFGFVKKDKTIVIFNMSGPCIQGPGFVVREQNPIYKDLFQLVFAGWDM